MSKIFEQLLEKRGFDEEFLYPKYEKLSDPFLLPDMKKAVERIKRAIEKGEKILIAGDYDADGVTASTLLSEALMLSGVKPENIDIMLPDRFVDGYGMSPKLVALAKGTGATLVISVDCGSRNHQVIDELKAVGVDTIVTDHHEVGETLPGAVAVVNPKRRDFADTKGQLKNLAGVGVAFKLAQGLVNKKFIQSGQEKWLLDLVVIGTICDSMILTGENRILCYYGMKVLEKTRRVGLRELMRATKVKKITSESIGFLIGPRLNVAGRLESAEIALKLMRTKSGAEAVGLVNKLEELNKERKRKQSLIMKKIETRGIRMDEPVIIETGEYPEGILGIVASRLVEAYRRPAFVLTEAKEGILKGSARSFGEFNLAKAIENAGDAILGGGGHAAAAGVKIEKQNLGIFKTKVNEYYRSLNLVNQERFLRRQADFKVDDLSGFSLGLLDELALLEPFGVGNEEPVFSLANIEIEQAMRMGADKNHLKLFLKDKKQNRLETVAFFADEKWLRLTADDKIRPMVQVMANEFRGVVTLEGRLVDLDMI